jgi:hypothetical protein
LRLKACFHRFFSGFSLKMEATYEKQHDRNNPFFNICFNLILGVEKPKEVNWWKHLRGRALFAKRKNRDICYLWHK